MTVRTFVFCDLCNAGATRYVEQRRDSGRGDRDGRRSTDGRAWVEAGEAEAVAAFGWRLDAEGRHVCPPCQRRRAGRA